MPIGISISDEMPGPWRRNGTSHLIGRSLIFQSQTRCQAPGDSATIRLDFSGDSISISDEMPGPWRRSSRLSSSCARFYFNLRRDARPLATGSLAIAQVKVWLFQSQTRCQALGSLSPARIELIVPLFQSQTRCQAPGDHEHDRYAEHDHKISISDEMPGPWRPQHPFAGCLCARYFNLRRDARPLATTIVNSVATPFMDFNLRRDARPLATSSSRNTCEASRYISISDEMPGPWRRLSLTQQPDGDTIFQSQTRCQAPGDAEIKSCCLDSLIISISDEMPGPWRPLPTLM